MDLSTILLFLFIGALALFTGLAFLTNGMIEKNQGKLAAAIAQLTERFGTGDYHATLPECRCIGIAWDSEQLVIGDDPDRAIGIPFADIRGAEIEMDGVEVTTSRTTTSTNRGSQFVGGAIGAAALGPVGLLAGGLSGSSTATGTATAEHKVKTVKLVVRVADRQSPLRRYSFYDAGYGEGYPTSSLIVKPSIEKCAHYHALIMQIMEERYRLTEQQWGKAL